MKKKLLIIKKFGGTSLSNIDKIKKAAKLVKKEVILGNKVVVVVSALGKTTDKLQSLINKISLNGNSKEIDSILSYIKSHWEDEIYERQISISK